MSHEKIDKILDYLDVPTLHAIAIALTFTDVENILKVSSLILAIGYTLWKWRSEYKKKDEKTTNTRFSNKRNKLQK